MNETEQGWYFSEMRWNDRRRMEWKKYELMGEKGVDADFFFFFFEKNRHVRLSI